MTAHQDFKLALQAFQSQRLRRDLADLAAEAQYQQIGQFFFDEMYGARDFSCYFTHNLAKNGSITWPK